MPLRLTLFPPDQAGTRHLVAEGRSYRVGRDPHADIILADPRISRDHLLIDGTGDSWRIEDLASKNGTRLDGRPIHDAELSGRVWLSIGGVPALAEPINDLRARTDVLTESDRRSATARIRHALGPEQAADALVMRGLEALRRVAGCERSGLWLSGQNGQPEMVRLLGPAEPPPSRGVIRQVIESQRAVFSSDTSDSDPLAGHESIVTGGIRAVAALPLLQDEHLLGVMYADSRTPGKLFTDLDADLLVEIAGQVALTLAAARLRGAIEKLRADSRHATGPDDPHFLRLLDQAQPDADHPG